MVKQESVGKLIMQLVIARQSAKRYIVGEDMESGLGTALEEPTK